MWRKEYPYLNNANFLKLVDTQHLQDQYIKITLLDWDENPIKEIQGMATGGSISINGDSAIRRTCTLNMTIKNIEDAKITNVRNLISIGRKIYLEIGLSNHTGMYEEEYPIVWYPQGYFVFTQCSLTSGVNNGITLSAQLKDKMCLLNGECGGIFPSTIQFDKWDTIDSDGNWYTEKITMAQIIREAVHHWGKEQLGKILISDIDEKVKMVMRWVGDHPVYLINEGGNKRFSMDKSTTGGIKTYTYGDDIGFIYTDFTYPGDLIANPGDNICTAVLDKIKVALGNFEYFYDIYGNFVFQEIKDYKNTTQAKIEIDKLKNDDYVIDISKGKSAYDLRNNELLMTFSNTPQYNRIKNDFVIWGTRTNSKDVKVPIRYHLAIDKKPEVGDIFDVYFYVDPEDGLRKAKVPAGFESKDNFPVPGDTDIFYLDKSTGLNYKWDPAQKKYVSPTGYATLEYNSYNDFPSEPSTEIIYIDKSTNKTYMWKTQMGAHYMEVQAQIDALTTEYNEDIQEQQTLVNTYTMQIENVESQIEALNKNPNFESALIQLERYTQDYENMGESIQINTNKIAENNEIITSLNGTITYLTSVYNALIEEAQAETDPDRKAILLEQAAEVLEQKENAEAERTALQNENQVIAATLNSLNATKDFDEEMMNQLSQELTTAGYYEQLQTLQSAKSGFEILKNQALSRIDSITTEYNTDLAVLIYQQKQYVETRDDSLVKVQTTDWRSQLYLQGAAAEALGLDSNYYYAELNAEWPKIYNLTANSYTDGQGQTIYTGAFKSEALDYPWDLDYWLDFIDSETEIGGLSVSNIGRRSLSESKEEYNCVFEPEINDYILIETGQPDTEEKREECQARNQDYIQVDPVIYNQIAIGGLRNSCFERVKEALYDYTAYNNSISITTMPIYHLDVKQRINVLSQQNDIYGDHLINSISVPLTIEGTMNISANKCNAKL